MSLLEGIFRRPISNGIPEMAKSNVAKIVHLVIEMDINAFAEADVDDQCLRDMHAKQSTVVWHYQQRCPVQVSCRPDAFSSLRSEYVVAQSKEGVQLNEPIMATRR
jgi:hypothetical protein